MSVLGTVVYPGWRTSRTICLHRCSWLVMNLLVEIVSMLFMTAVDPQAARVEKSVSCGGVREQCANRSKGNDGKPRALQTNPIKARRWTEEVD